MGDGEKSLPSLDATILVRNTTEAEARVSADTLEGTRLKHFEVVRLLGRGGMGAVYYGSDTSLERPVAIKVLAPEFAHDPEVVVRFEREARAQARLRHPNVAQIYFIGEDRGVHFFVMEYLEGPGLDSLLAQPEPLPWAKALEYTIAAARGLRAAFAQGFVHRDVKPSNLMLDREAGIKILDFGLVKSMHGDSQLTRDGAIIGSPLYMSPEQGRGGAVDLRSDIYSLGCALYHMLCGRPPFSGPSPVGVISMHVTDKAAPVRVLNPNVPEVLARIVERMMAKEPADRFASYDDLLAALESARADRRQLSGFRTRGIALAIDGLLLAAVAYFIGPWVLAVAFAYFVLFHRLLGQTPGKWLLGIRVEDPVGSRISWKAALIRFLVFAWGPLAWTVLAVVVYSLHHNERVAFRLDSLTLSQLALPALYVALATAILVAYLAGFLLVAFHPRRLALHDILARTEVRFKARPPAEQVVEAVKATTFTRRSR
ncbi:MAG: protein kinase [Polyangia bacterium]